MAGGGILARKIEERIKQAKSAQGKTLEVGFFENATYPDGKKVAEIASIQEYGATIQKEASTQTVYRKINKDGSFANNGQFAKKNNANFSTTHDVAAHTIQIPPRPFFRNAIAKDKNEWVDKARRMIKEGRNLDEVMSILGVMIQESVIDSILNFDSPPLSKSTIAAKKAKGKSDSDAAKPLIDDWVMINNVQWDIKND